MFTKFARQEEVVTYQFEQSEAVLSHFSSSEQIDSFCTHGRNEQELSAHLVPQIGMRYRIDSLFIDTYRDWLGAATNYAKLQGLPAVTKSDH